AGKVYGSLTPNQKTVKLTQKQADEINRALVSSRKGGVAPEPVGREVSALQVARLAEDMGVIRQGRFLELMEESGRLQKPKGTHAWQNLTKRVEDSTRMATFLGGLQRGMGPREAATRASKIHFDYGDLTAIEKRVLRRIAPFYTFTARNVPLQARYLVTRPGKAATLQKAREEGAKAAGLPEGYEEGLDPFEMRQLGIPITIGGRTQTVSTGSPWVDLNEVVAGGVGAVEGFKSGGVVGAVKGGIGKGTTAAVRRAIEISGGPEKLIPELVLNYSFFYRDEIEPSDSPEVRAPEWAQWMGRKTPGWAKAVGLAPFVDSEGNETVGWGKKTDYAFRNLAIGPFGVVLRSPPFGTEGRSARDMTPTQSALTSFGVRTKDYRPDQAELTALYKTRDKVKADMDRLNSRPHPTQRQANGRPYLINADHPTARYKALSDANKANEKRIDELLRKVKPKGFVKGRPVSEVSGSTAAPGGIAVPAPRSAGSGPAIAIPPPR
ncbi:MAG TPA: hypothetical protein VK631_13390, partial [Solirubrobacteraceae bacterium]|nr:hypothetical protein [Solirubrobacteraceae bacterium]